MLGLRSAVRVDTVFGQALVGQWKPSRSICSCTLVVWILTVTITHPVGSRWSSRLRRSQPEDMVFQLRVLVRSVDCLGVHRTRDTSGIESSQHRLHRHRPSFVCSQRQQAMHSVYNHNFSPPSRQCAGRHGCWAQHAPILNLLHHGTSNTSHKASRVQPASAAPSSAVIRMFATAAGNDSVYNHNFSPPGRQCAPLHGAVLAGRKPRRLPRPPGVP